MHKRQSLAGKTVYAFIGALAAATFLQGASSVQASERLLGEFRDWSAYAATDRGERVCYAVTKPKRRLPDHLRRGDGFLFVSFRPAERSRNEVALVLGFPASENRPGSARVDDGRRFELTARGGNAWLNNASQENEIVQAFARGRNLEVEVRSARGNETKDVYSLLGFTAAMNRAKRECGM